MNEIQIFQSEEFGELRTILRDGEIWFVAADVCGILGVDTSTSVNGRNRKDEDGEVYRDGGLDADEKDTVNVSTLGGEQQMLVVSEPGLYALVLKSRKPDAKRFRRWVIHDILPTIRKHGAYLTDAKIEEVLLNPDTIITLATQIKEERQKRFLAEQQVQEMKPLAEFADHVSNTKDLIDVGRMAKLLHDEHIDIGRNKLFQWLRDNRILMKNNTPYQSYVDGGYFKVRESTQDTAYGSKIYTTTYVTGKGQIYITERLRKELTKVAS